MARTTADLIHELRSETSKFNVLQLVVGFETSSEFVNADDPEALDKLDRLVSAGGEPIGMIGLKMRPGRFYLYSRVLSEYRDEQWADDFLRAIAREKARAIPNALPIEEGWIS